MKTALFCLALTGLSAPIGGADELRISTKDKPSARFSDPDALDWLRTHLVFVFDIAEHHCQKDSESSWKPSAKEIKGLVTRLEEGSHLSFSFSVPTPITVESKRFLMKRLWVRIREEDWGTFDWVLETPKGDLVALSGVEGTYNRRLGPIIRAFVENAEHETSQ